MNNMLPHLTYYILFSTTAAHYSLTNAAAGLVRTVTQRQGTPGGVKYFGKLEEHCFWGNEVKLYEHHVDKLFAMFWHKKPNIEYINKTFAKPGQRMYFQVEYTEDKLQEYIQEDDDTLPLKLGDGTVSCDSRFILGTDKRATITTNWSWFRHHANIQEGDICAFHFKRKEGRRLSLTVHRL